MAAVSGAKASEDFYKAKLATGRFFLKRLLPRYVSLSEAVKGGSEPLYGLDEAMFETAPISFGLDCA